MALFLVGQRGFSSKHFLQISSYIETNTKEEPKRYSDTVFIEISPEYVRKNKIALSVGAIDLRNMGYAIKECLKNQKSSYIKFTEPSRGGFAGERKSLSFALDDKTLYLNIESGGKKIGMGFDFYNAASFADIITLMAEETEKKLYQYQRQTNNTEHL